MTLTYSEDPAAKLMEFTVSGHLGREEYDAVIEQVQAFIDTHGTVRMIEVIESFPTFDPSILLPGIRFDIKNLSHISHVAVVTDIGWLSPITRAAGAFMSTKMRVFETKDIEAARDWVRTAES
ncbi:STAS/SEC14 domain-containing protein [Cognatishimia sp. F0-27]|uniref:STAS/SEC14 domain-containing protein n=1 Tax=Cognatishimia sp. F0-27 TaxID=2816855 RepID=UPI001D0C8862|nr:STAS/SEC14 domain-containing protein [Cognatishimia sp. F0-27]MCC1493964.1 STAS/SEC14 domain-containing protein [Cognatishimia sp. F0-27]